MKKLFDLNNRKAQERHFFIQIEYGSSRPLENPAATVVTPGHNDV